MCMVEDADEPFKVYRRETRRAAKPRKCDECGRSIQPGESYRWATGLMDGAWDQFVICAHCGVAADWLSRECGGYLHHGIEEDIKEHAEEYNRFGLWRFYVCIRDGWKGRAGLRPIPRQLEVHVD